MAKRDDDNMIIIVQAIVIAFSYFLEWLFSPSESNKNK